MRKLFSRLLIGLLLCLNALALAAGSEPVDLQFLLVNDFHGHIRQEKEDPGAVKLYMTVHNLTELNPDGTILVGGGDMLSGMLDCNEFRGRPAIEMMNEMGFVADVVGNHAFDNNGRVIEQQRRWAKFPFLAANIKDASGGEAKSFIPSLLLSRKGVKIGIVGLATMETPVKAKKSNMIGFSFTDPDVAGNKAIRALRQQGAQIIVLAAHMATFQDKTGKISGDELLNLLDKLEPVDIILSAHSHEMVAGTVQVHGKTLPVVQSGWAGQNVAVVKVQYDQKQQSITKTETYLQETATTRVKTEPALFNRMQDFLNAVDAKYRTPLAYNERALVSDRWDPYGGTCAEVLTDLLRKESGAQVVIYNGGGFREGLPAGNLTMVNLMDVFPFNGTVYLVDLKGSDLKKVIAHGLDNKKYGFVRFSGLKVTGQVKAPEAERIKDITFLNGDPVVDEQYYRVLTNDFLLSGGDDYVMFKNAKNIVKKGLEIPLVKKAVQRAGKIDYQSDGRLNITDFGLGAQTVKHHA